METIRRFVPHLNSITDWLPRSQRLVAERRRHPRALLSIPVRLRWLGPLGLESEISETLDAGRGGILVPSREPRAEGELAWVTFPYVASAAAEPETPAHVARSKTTPSGGYLAGIALAECNRRAHAAADSDSSANPRTSNVYRGADRRGHPRTRLALPIRVRGADPAWPEDTMTMDISRRGLQFCTLRVYDEGEQMTLALPRSPLLSGGNRRARVARISSHPADPRLLCIGAEYLS
jgi:hypothetical protein